MRTSKNSGRMRRVRRLVGVLAVVVLLAGWWTWLRSPALGGSTTAVTVSGHSMEPGMHTGDLALVRRTHDYVVGDVVAYRPPKKDAAHTSGVVIHRIVGGDANNGFVLRGDNNDFDDPWKLHAEDIIGERIFHAPSVGAWIGKLRQPVNAGAAVAAVVVFLILVGGRDAKDSDKERAGQPPAHSEGTS